MFTPIYGAYKSVAAYIRDKVFKKALFLFFGQVFNLILMITS